MYFWWQSIVKPKYCPLKTLQSGNTCPSHLCYRSIGSTLYGSIISLIITTLHTMLGFTITDQ